MIYSLCYPTLSDSDNVFIQSFRKKHDLPFIDVVSHHFTIAFGISDLPKDAYIDHVKEQVKNQKQITFTCKYAMLGNDDSNDNYYVFLVPDKGNSDISLLHDQIYKGKLNKFHRLDIPFIPHIGIATIPDAQKVKELCDELNSSSISISGSIDSITICEYDGKIISDIANIEFKA